ncbi:MAG: histidine phosphatase superfamily [Monoraphidium minutum]|nr:MAG: histidine phosphatase superfamily [Monoraphidium minutum]
MRHGHRQDEADPTWSRVATRPWDPPLSTKGRTQAREAAAAMRDLGIDLVVTSPFKRCLQTSAEIVAELGLPQGAWLVDWGLSEICDPRVLLHGRPDCEHMARGRPLDAWMWGGASLEEALELFVESCAEQLPSLRARPAPRDGPRPPPFPEVLEGGLKRYGRAVQQLVWAYPGRRLLVVSHGECVRAIVNMIEPNSEVFEVRHVGYVVLQYESPDGGARGGDRGWRLALSDAGETGVFWLWEDN